MTHNFDEALAEHGSAKEAIFQCLRLACHNNGGCLQDGYVSEAQWVLDNAAAIHQHQNGKNERGTQIILQRVAVFEQETNDSLAQIDKRIQQLEDAPGPRANQEEVSALRQRMDGLAETLEKMQPLDTSDVLERLVQDVALLKDWVVLTYTQDGYEKARQFRNTYIGTEPATSEARKMLGLDGPMPEPEPVYEWVGNDYYFDGKVIGGILQLFTGEWLAAWRVGHGSRSKSHFTQAEARAWVEAQFNTTKQ